jgi:NAD(P)-dependent dehydrogenase (short-subunit alcohol dehydrogenase family)
VEEQVEVAVKKTVEKFGRIDVAFNAAGISGEPGKTGDLTGEQMSKVLDLNAKGVWFCQRAQIRAMVKQDERALT